MYAETQDVELEMENVLQQIFIGCNASVSPSTPDSTSDAVPITKLVKYVQDELPSWSIDNLVELWKCLAAVSTSDCVNLHQFKKATKCWIAKIQQSLQDGNNNAQEKLYLVNDADSSMKIMDVNRDIVELELREKFRVVSEENISLREEVERHEASIDNFKRQRSITENKLKYYTQKCQELEKENDEQRDQLNELIGKEKIMSSALQKYMKENEKLMKKLEAAQIEVQAISSLEEKLQKVTKEKMDCIKKINKMQKELNEKDEAYRKLETMVITLEDTNNSMKKSYEDDIRDLREINRQLTDKNSELQSSSSFSAFPSLQERLSLSPIPDTSACYKHSTPYTSKEVPVQDSLYTELKALGITHERSREHDIHELEEQLNEYDDAILAILKKLEKVIQIFVTMRGSSDDLSHFSSQSMDEKAYVDVLEHKTAFLLHMVKEESTRWNTRRDASTQLRADLANATGSLDQFGIRSFRDLLHAYRSIHTLPSSLQSLESSSLTAEDSRWRTFGYQNSGTNTDAPFTREDRLTREDRGEKFTLLAAEARGVSDQEDPARSEENQSCEMPKVPSVLQIDSKATLEKEEGKTSATSFQVPEVSSASTPTSPRRKISVYCRSFDVVAVEDRREDHPGSNLEVRQSPSDSDSLAQIDRIAERNIYRNVKSDSDSSNSTPQKFQDSLLDDEPPLVGKPILRKVRLAPTRLKFPQEPGNELARTAKASDCASPVPVNSTELDILELPLSPIGEHKEDDDASVHSSMFIDEPKMEVKSAIVGPKSCLNKNVSQAYSMPNRRLLPCGQGDSAKIADSEDPHSKTSVRRVDSETQSRFERSVDSQMLSREDSLAVSDDEPATGSGDRCGINEKVAIEAEKGKAVNVVSSTSLADPVFPRLSPCKSDEQDVRKTKQEIRQWLLKMNRSFSEGENLARSKYGCVCRQRNASSIPENCQRRVFPSLTDVRLQESGIANLSDSQESSENLNELELQKKYTAFSLCLSIDRLTLPRRIALSCRQRDQSERNLFCEVQKMQQDIQEIVRQRNSVSGRMTIRRPSFSSECPREIETLDRTESSNSVGELRGIFEQTESRRSSREENNDMLRSSHSNSQSAINCGIIDNEVWTNVKEEISPELSGDERINSDNKSNTRSSHSFQVKRRRKRRLSIWHIMLTSIVIFCFVFYVIQAMSVVNTCHESLNERLIRCVVDRYRQMRSTAPHPM